MTFICIFYYVFSLFFMIGYVLNADEDNPWIIAAGIVCMIILAPILLPLNLGMFVSRNSD